MKRLFGAAAGIVLLALGACSGGGGGGGETRQVSGRVLSVSTGGPVDPAATVQIGSRTDRTDADGLFSLRAALGATVATVASAFPTFTFTFPPISADTDLGDLWVGPEAVTVVGTVVESTTSLPLPDVAIRFAGKRALTNSLGQFTLTEVAYDPGADFVFFGIFGSAEKSGYLRSEFSANTPPIGGVVTIPLINLAPLSDPTPPPPPGNLYGTVTLQGGGNSSGTIVTVLQGGNPVRQQTLGDDQKYRFWVVPSDYTIRFERSGFQTLEIQITGFTNSDQSFKNDVTLFP